MKTYLVTSLIFASTLSLANEIKVDRSAHAVRVNSVSTEIIGHGFPSTQVKASATFGNECEVPQSEELVKIVQYSKDFRNLVISLGDQSTRLCPAVYRPVTVTLDLGLYTKPNDGLFSNVIVNGKSAR
jgi:hypothetical protein